MPNFIEGLSVKCSGLIVYKVKDLGLNMNNSSSNNEIHEKEYQTPFPSVELVASDLHNHYVDLDSTKVKAGIVYNN